VRWRTVLYAAGIALAGGIMLYSLATRQTTGLNLIHDRNPVFVRLSDGGIRNAYTLRILNMRRETRQFTLAVENLPGGVVSAIGAQENGSGHPVLEVGPDQTREFRVLLAGTAKAASTPVTFVLRDLRSGETTTASDYFRGPEARP
jgi:polyferredoxin